MTPDEFARLVKAETRVEMLQQEVATLRSDFHAALAVMKNEHTEAFNALSMRLDEIKDIVSRGQGAWWILTKMATVAAVLATAIFALGKQAMQWLHH